jgi:ribosome modulation factor
MYGWNEWLAVALLLQHMQHAASAQRSAYNTAAVHVHELCSYNQMYTWMDGWRGSPSVEMIERR